MQRGRQAAKRCAGPALERRDYTHCRRPFHSSAVCSRGCSLSRFSIEWVRRVRATCCPAERDSDNGVAQPHRRAPQAGRHLSAAAAVHLPLGGVAALQGQGRIPLDAPRRLARPQVSEMRPLTRRFFSFVFMLFLRKHIDGDGPMAMRCHRGIGLWPSWHHLEN